VRPVDPAGHDETDPGVAEPSLDRTDSTDFLDSAGLGRDDPGNGAAPTAYSPAIDVPLALDEESSDGDLPAGLPRRVPMAWLVPGAPSMAEAESIDRRDPERVAATMAAYQRGVAASRAKRGIDPASLATATTTE
jgi:hypothetical protein